MLELQETVESRLVLPEVMQRLTNARRDTRRTPFTTLTYAQSIDGSISCDQRCPLRLSNKHSHRLTHQLRSVHDAILVGIDTVLIDDPRLTVRLVEGRNPQPVILDSRLRFPATARLLQTPHMSPIIATGSNPCRRTRRRLIHAGAQIVETPEVQPGRLDLQWLMAWLKNKGFESLMVEGGARVITSCLRQCLADQLVLTICPTFVGGYSAITDAARLHMIGATRLSNVHFEILAGDVIVRGDFPMAN